MRKILVKMTAAAAALAIAAGIPALPVLAAPTKGDSTYIAADVQEARADAFRDCREYKTQTMNNVYLLPDSDTYYISESDISWMDDNELMLARNEFYARRGRKFVTKSIQEYFNRQGWYDGRIEPDEFTSDLFNRYEQANVDFIVAYENKRREIREQKEKEKQQQKKKEKQKKVNRLDSSVSTPSVSVSSVSSKQMKRFRGICSLYTDAIRQGWNEEDCEVAGVNHLILGMSDPDELGYVFRDLDNDGEEEFLIGPTDAQVYGEGAVFVIYTVEDELPVILVSSDENNMYYVCSDNTICREMTDEDGFLELDYLDLSDGDLLWKSSIVMNEGIDADDPWFILEDPETEWEETSLAEGTIGFDVLEGITYEEASKARSAYLAESLNFTPIEKD